MYREYPMISPETSDERWVRIIFDNPLTKKTDSIRIRQKVLEALREKQQRKIISVSFFLTVEGKSRLMTLQIDHDNKVRTRYLSEFFLETGGKLYPSDGDFIPSGMNS